MNEPLSSGPAGEEVDPPLALATQALLCPRCQSERIETRSYGKKIGGALGWLGGRYAAGGAVDGGGSSVFRTTTVLGGVTAAAADTRGTAGTCRATHNGHSGQSTGWPGVFDGAPLLSV